MKSITYQQFLRFHPCYLYNPERKALMDSIAQRQERWTALDILALEEIPAEDRLWAVRWTEFIPPKLLNEFGCRCAERALSRIEHPDPRSVAAIEAKRKWLRGEISDEELDAARVAARAAAWAAARGVESDAAWAAVGAVESDAAWAAAWCAALVSANAAEEIAERIWQVAELRKLLREETL